LDRLGFPLSDNNIRALVAVQAIEGGHNNGASFNPMNTGQPMDGSHVWHVLSPSTGFGIQAYTSWEQGIDATVKTLLNPKFDYSGILKALGASAAPDETIRQWGLSPWGWNRPVSKAAAYWYYANKTYPGATGLLKGVFSKKSGKALAWAMGAGVLVMLALASYELTKRDTSRD
jgi:hypothetical protein